MSLQAQSTRKDSAKTAAGGSRGIDLRKKSLGEPHSVPILCPMCGSDLRNGWSWSGPRILCHACRDYFILGAS